VGGAARLNPGAGRAKDRHCSVRSLMAPALFLFFQLRSHYFLLTMKARTDNCSEPARMLQRGDRVLIPGNFTAAGCAAA